MPVHSGTDSKGSFMQWGKSGKKYYYKPSDKNSKRRATEQAHKQARAIYSSGYRG